MYKKYLIIASKLDQAGMNIALALSQFRENPLLSSMKNEPSFDISLVETEIVDDSGMNKELIGKYDFVIFASKHQSSQGGKTLSIHTPGNFRKAEMGGESEKVCPTSALFQKALFEELDKKVEEHSLRNYQVTLECTHHGPLINKPCVFIEIGATPNEWRDKRAAFVIAKTIKDTIQNFKPNQYREIAVGIGGPHYCPNFNPIQLKSNVALSHIIPSYVLPIKEDNILEAIAKTEEELDFVILDWKSIGPEESRKQITDILERNHIQYKKIKEIKK